jgi:NAD(P)-dependent dehydrogenase (short-subunit alcohol dehydrogenase family)
MIRSEHRRPSGRALAAAGLGLAAVGRAVYRHSRRADLQGEVALVTGGTRGLGLLVAHELAGEGCRLVICARDAAELERAAGELRAAGAEVLPLACDVADQAAVERTVAAATAHYGRIDLLVNNAGVITAGPAPVMTARDFEWAMSIMFWGTLYPILAVLPQMRARRRGRIVNITSVGGKVAVPHLLPYAAAKFAATGLSQGLRAELARDGIAVTTVAPGLMRTGSVLNAFFKGQPEREFAPFAVLATLPFFSIDARRAARQVVRAARRGEAERVLALSANLLTRFHGLFPGLTADILGLLNRVLPGPGGEAGQAPAAAAPVRGMELHERVRSEAFDALIGWNLAAARELHQYPGPVGDTGAPGAAPVPAAPPVRT